MSAHQFFAEVEAVAEELDAWVRSVPEDYEHAEDPSFIAAWQAVELLSRAYAVLLPLVSYEQAKARLEHAQGYLEIPDPVVTDE